MRLAIVFSLCFGICLQTVVTQNPEGMKVTRELHSQVMKNLEQRLGKDVVLPSLEPSSDQATKQSQNLAQKRQAERVELANRLIKFYVKKRPQEVQQKDAYQTLHDIFANSTSEELSSCCSDVDKEGLSNWQELCRKPSSPYGPLLQRFVVMLEIQKIRKQLSNISENDQLGNYAKEVLSLKCLKPYLSDVREQLSKNGHQFDSKLMATAVTAVLGSPARNVSSNDLNKINSAYNFLDKVCVEIFPRLSPGLREYGYTLLQRVAASEVGQKNSWTHENFQGLALYNCLQDFVYDQCNHYLKNRLNFAGLETSWAALERNHAEKVEKFYQQSKEIHDQQSKKIGAFMQSIYQQYVYATRQKMNTTHDAMGQALVASYLDRKHKIYDENNRLMNVVGRLVQKNSGTLSNRYFQNWQLWAVQQRAGKTTITPDISFLPGLSDSASSESDVVVLEKQDEAAPCSSGSSGYVSRRGLALGLPFWLWNPQAERDRGSPQSPYVCGHYLEYGIFRWHAPDRATWWIMPDGSYHWRSADGKMLGSSWNGHLWWVYPRKPGRRSMGQWRTTITNL